MTGIKPGDIVKTKDNFHANVIRAGDQNGRKGWIISPLENWAKSRRFCTSRDVIGVYRPLKGSK